MAQTDTGVGELRALVDILKSTVDKLDQTMAGRGQTFPSLHELYSVESEAPRNSPEVLALCDVLVSAAGQLIAAARPTPTSSLLTSLQVESYGYSKLPLLTVPQFQTSACLRAVIRAHVPEILREAGPKVCRSRFHVVGFSLTLSAGSSHLPDRWTIEGRTQQARYAPFFQLLLSNYH